MEEGRFLFPHYFLMSRGFQVAQILSIIPITIQLEMVDVVKFLQESKEQRKRNLDCLRALSSH